MANGNTFAALFDKGSLGGREETRKQLAVTLCFRRLSLASEKQGRSFQLQVKKNASA